MWKIQSAAREGSTLSHGWRLQGKVHAYTYTHARAHPPTRGGGGGTRGEECTWPWTPVAKSHRIHSSVLLLINILMYSDKDLAFFGFRVTRKNKSGHRKTKPNTRGCQHQNGGEIYIRPRKIIEKKKHWNRALPPIMLPTNPQGLADDLAPDSADI